MHYTQRWQTGKAMLVCLDKITAVRMHGLIDKYWQQAINKQQQRIKQATDDQDAIEQQKYLHWLQETEYLVVISDSQNEVKTFRDDWKIDIKPHREKIISRSRGIHAHEQVACRVNFGKTHQNLLTRVGCIRLSE